MSNEQRWRVSDALGLLLQISRACCLAPVRFVVIRNETFVYISRSLFLFSLIVVTFIDLCTIYHLYLWIHLAEKANYNKILLKIYNVCIIIIFLSFAVLRSDTRMRNYIRCFTNLKKVIKSLNNTEETNTKKWHVLIIFIVSSVGVNFVLIFSSLMSSTSFSFLTDLLILEFTMASIYQQQFVYFALNINFVLKLIREQLKEELAEIIDDDGRHCEGLTTTRVNIPLESINKAIDMIGRTGIVLSNRRHTRRQDIAQRIRQINDCYVSTCDAFQELNISDNVLLFWQIIYISVTIVFSSYDNIHLLQQGDSSLVEQLLHFLQFVFLVIQIIMLIEPCHVAMEKVAKIRYLVCEIMCYVSSENDPILFEIRAFFKQLILINISYTALGIFNIARPLITSIIGAVTTILIMVFEL